MTVPRNLTNHRDSNADVLVRDSPLCANRSEDAEHKNEEQEVESPIQGYGHQAKRQHRHHDEFSTTGSVENLAHERLNEAVQQNSQTCRKGNCEPVPFEFLGHRGNEMHRTRCVRRRRRSRQTRTPQRHTSRRKPGAAWGY